MKYNENNMGKQFSGQRDDEEVIYVFRRHIIAMRKGFYLLLIPFTLASIPSLIWPGSFELLYLAMAGFGIGLLLFFYQWILWYFTIFILTDQRLRQVKQQGFFGKNVIDLGVSKIQNISYNVPGLTGEMFKFGTIVVQTYVGDLVLDKIHHPDEVYNKLQDVIVDVTNKRDEDEEIER